MQDATFESLMDAVYFAATQGRVIEQLEQAMRSVRHAEHDQVPRGYFGLN